MSKLPDSHILESQKAPAFSLESNTGEKITLSKLKGSFFLLYFYPKDNTPGCTVEAKEFNDLLPAFSSLGVTVLGISTDTVVSHCRFSEKYGLSFPLLADTEHAVADKYGVWVQKNMCGKKYMGIQRTTFLVDKEGVICRVWQKVKPNGHASEVFETIKTLNL